MIAERSRKVFRSKNKVNVESSENAAKKEMEEPTPITKRERAPEIDPRNTIPVARTYAPTTTQSIQQSSKAIQDCKQIQRGRQIASEGNYHQAIASFNEILPATFDSLYYRGCARLELCEQIEFYNAIEDFNQALKISQQHCDPGIYYKRAFACQSIGRYAEAVIDYSMFIQYKRQNTHKGYLSRGLVYSEITEYDKALDDIVHANSVCPQPPSKYYVYCLARVQTSAGQYEDARKTFNKLAEICRDEINKSSATFNTYFYYGIAQYELNDYSTALQHFNEALKHTSSTKNRIDTIFYIGLTQYALGNIDLARKEFDHVLTLDGNYTRALFRLGMLHSQNDKSQSEALNYLTKAHQLAPHRPDILYQRGRLHHEMGHLDACIHDKRSALQLGRADADLAIFKHYYESLIQQLSSMLKVKSTLPNDMYLVLALLLEKVSTLSYDANRTSVSDKEYRQMISYCEQEIDKNPNDIHSVLSFAVLCNSHEKKKHHAASMISLDQLNDVLDKNSTIEEAWHQMLVDIREMKEKQTASQSENLQCVLEMINIQTNSLRTTDAEQMKKMLISLLVEQFAEFQKISTSRDAIKADEQHFVDDPNDNRRIFYRKMRCSLSHKFTAMAVTSGDGESEPLIRHDQTGTQTKIADGLGLLANFVGAVIPTGGEAVSFAATVLSSVLKGREYAKYQTRMSLIIEDRDTIELGDLARQVARELAGRYKEQLLSLKPSFGEVPQVCCCCSCCCPCPPWKTNAKSSDKTKPSEVKPPASCRCCPCPPWKNKVEPAEKKKSSGVQSPVKQVAQFGIAFAVQAIVHEKSEDINIYDDMETIDLAKSIAELICHAKPNLSSKVLRLMQLDKNKMLPRTPSTNSNKGEQLKSWYLYDFYQKPGIRVKSDNGETVDPTLLSWMNSDLYGYRLGTMEEYNHLVELDKKQTEKKCQNCCC